MALKVQHKLIDQPGRLTPGEGYLPPGKGRYNPFAEVDDPQKTQGVFRTSICNREEEKENTSPNVGSRSIYYSDKIPRSSSLCIPIKSKDKAKTIEESPEDLAIDKMIKKDEDTSKSWQEKTQFSFSGSIESVFVGDIQAYKKQHEQSRDMSKEKETSMPSPKNVSVAPRGGVSGKNNKDEPVSIQSSSALAFSQLSTPSSEGPLDDWALKNQEKLTPEISETDSRRKMEKGEKVVSSESYEGMSAGSSLIKSSSIVEQVKLKSLLDMTEDERSALDEETQFVMEL